MTQQALPGFRDFYPEQMAERAYVMQTWRDVVRRYAFVEYDGPPHELVELYTKKSGDEIVTQLYNFIDKGGREVALRPEMTPTLARMVGARANALRKPVRWFSIPQLFRYERQQKGRLREHFQLNVDMVGEGDVTADAELLACAIDIMRAFGLTSDDVVVRVSDRRILRGYLLSLGVPDECVTDVYVVIDKLQRQPPSVSSEKLLALGLAQQAIDAILSIETTTIDMVRAAVLASEAATAGTSQIIDDFMRYLHYANALVPGGASWVQFDLSIVRGLAYYTGIVFELFDRRGEFRAICGGGRYDTLLANLSGVDLPSLGFGMGDVVLSELLRARGRMPSVAPSVDYWIVTEDNVPVERAMQEAARLRTAGHSVEFSLRTQTLSKQFKSAKSAGARETITIK